MSANLLLNPQIPKIFYLLHTPTAPPPPFSASHKPYQPQFSTLNPRIMRRASSSSLSLIPRSVQFSRQNGSVEEDDEPVLGDCLVFEEGIFDDPFLQEESFNSRSDPPKRKKNSSTEVEPENLIPEKWTEMQREINITKKERRRLAYQMEFGRKLEKRREALRPIGSGSVKNVNLEGYMKFRDEKINQLKPLVLDNPEFSEDDEVGEKGGEEVTVTGSGEGKSDVGISSTRVAPRNPRLAVYGGGLDDVTEFFNSGLYDPSATKTSEGPRKLFTKDEKLLLNRRIPDLAAATSGRWHLLHTLASSGDFYLMTSLLKHNVDINASDKDGFTAIHKAILGNKQAIFNCLLRESANPFVRDKDGATLMHYAVRRASSQMIKILLLYNVDMNIQDNDGWAPLHLAVQSRRTDLVRLLLVKGADKTLKNRDGLTPLDLCLYSGRDMRTYELIKLLKQLPRGHHE